MSVWSLMQEHLIIALPYQCKCAKQCNIMCLEVSIEMELGCRTHVDSGCKNSHQRMCDGYTRCPSNGIVINFSTTIPTLNSWCTWSSIIPFAICVWSYSSKFVANIFDNISNASQQCCWTCVAKFDVQSHDVLTSTLKIWTKIWSLKVSPNLWTATWIK